MLPGPLVVGLHSLIDAWEQLAGPIFRIGGVMMSAPLFGARFVPARVRLLLTVAVSLVLWPVLPKAEWPDVFSAAGVLLIAAQVAFGIAMGFTLQLVFEAVTLGGELVSSQVGLSFAQLADPLRGSVSPVVSQFFLMLATLLFLALDGHHVLLLLLADSFNAWPVGRAFRLDDLQGLLIFAGRIFSGGVAIALPAVAALLIVNLGFGVINRTAPTLNLFSVGFPLSLVLGLLVLYLTLPTLVPVFAGLLDDAWQVLRRFVVHAHG